jgi:hypothetical protein
MEKERQENSELRMKNERSRKNEAGAKKKIPPKKGGTVSL